MNGIGAPIDFKKFAEEHGLANFAAQKNISCIHRIHFVCMDPGVMEVIVNDAAEDGNQRYYSISKEKIMALKALNQSNENGQFEFFQNLLIDIVKEPPQNQLIVTAPPPSICPAQFAEKEGVIKAMKYGFEQSGLKLDKVLEWPVSFRELGMGRMYVGVAYLPMRNVTPGAETKDVKNTPPNPQPDLIPAAVSFAEAAELPPKSMLCPITNKLLDDPVNDEFGHCYSRAALEERRRKTNIALVENKPYITFKITPDFVMKGVIEKWKKDHPISAKRDTV